MLTVLAPVKSGLSNADINCHSAAGASWDVRKWKEVSDLFYNGECHPLHGIDLARKFIFFQYHYNSTMYQFPLNTVSTVYHKIDAVDN